MALSRYASNRENPAWVILEHLQKSSSASIKELEVVLGVTTTAVRQHLNTLQAEGYVERRRVPGGVGRPHYAYQLSDKSQELFGCHCDDLALTLLEEVFLLEGSERAALLLNRVGNRLAEKYSSDVRSTVLHDRVEELAGAFYDRGVIADVSTDDNNTIVLHTYNCPYHELAQDHREICEMDQKMIRQVLGSDVNLSECMMDGHGSCSFIVEGVANVEEISQVNTDTPG
jgi:DeoR family suf operon transcriptional repressor